MHLASTFFDNGKGVEYFSSILTNYVFEEYKETIRAKSCGI